MTDVMGTQYITGGGLTRMGIVSIVSPEFQYIINNPCQLPNF